MYHTLREHLNHVLGYRRDFTWIIFVLFVFSQTAAYAGIFSPILPQDPTPNIDIAPPVKYIYVRNSDQFDDSWIGTPTTTSRSSLVQKSLTVSDGSWILPAKNVYTPKSNASWIGNFSKKQNIPSFSSAPTLSPTQNNPGTSLYLPGYTTPVSVLYATPNGSSIFSISSSSNSSQSVSNGSIVNGVQTIHGDQSISGNSIISGSQNIGWNLTIRTPGSGATVLLGRDATGTIMDVLLGSGMTFVDGVLGVDMLSGASLMSSSLSDALLSGITTFDGDIIASGSMSLQGTGTFASLVAPFASITHLMTDVLSVTSGNFDSLFTNALSTPTAHVSNLLAQTIITGDFTSTGTANFQDVNVAGNAKFWTASFSIFPTFPLSHGALIQGNTLNQASELLPGLDNQVLIILNGVPTWTDSSVISPVLSVYGRTGSVLAQAGDYTTDQVIEANNLYWTQGRFDTAFWAKSTTHLIEWDNLYFTNARARGAISATGPISYLMSSGVISWNGTTDDVNEGVNHLYWTDTRFSDALDSQKNRAGGVAWLDANAKVPVVNLPGITMNAVWTASDLNGCAAQTSAVRWDICIASSDSRSYVLSTNSPTNLGDWQELLNPAAPVSMVNGQVGNINFIGTQGVTVSGTTIALTSVGTGGIYGNSTSIPIITTDAQWRVTNVTVTTIPTATAGQLWLLSPTDYARFSAKQDAISAYNGLTLVGTGLKLWGTLTENTTITQSGYTMSFMGWNVGIGTTTPTNNLQIGTTAVVTTSTPTTLSLGGTYSFVAGSNPKIKVWENGIGAYYGFGVSSSQMEYIAGQAGWRHAFFVNASTNPAVVIASNGAMGIGTTTPGTSLDVFTNTDVYGIRTGDSANANLRISGTATGPNGYSLLQSFRGNTASGNLILQRDAGFVGIGTAAPTVKFEVDSKTVWDSGFKLSQLKYGTAYSAVNSLAMGVDSTGKVGFTNALASFDTRSTNDLPNARNAGLYTDFKLNSTNGLNDGATYNGVLTFRPYGFGNDLSSGYPLQIGMTQNGNMWTRIGTSSTTWGTWNKILNDKTGWSTLGNSGTTVSNFIGTTDNMVLNFKTNNIARMQLSSGLAGSGFSLAFQDATSNTLLWNTAGTALPTVWTRSIGTKLVLYPNLSATQGDYAIGVGPSTLWNSVPTTTGIFSWYGGTGSMMSLSNNQLLMAQTGANLSISGPNAFGAIGRVPSVGTVWDVYRNILSDGYNSRYGLRVTINRTEANDLTAGGVIYTMGQNTSVAYTQSALHTLWEVNVHGANISTTMNLTKSGAAANGYGIVNTVRSSGHFTSLMGMSSSVASTSNSLTDLGGLYGISQSAYNDGDGYVSSVYGIGSRAYNNSNTGTIGSLYGMNVNTIISVGKGSVTNNYGINIAASNGNTIQRALNFASYINDPLRNPSIIEGIYGNAYYVVPNTTIGTVRGQYISAYVSTGSALITRGAEILAQDGINSTIGVMGKAQANLIQTGAYLRGGNFFTDIVGATGTTRVINDAIGVFGYTTNTLGSAWGTMTNQYGAYFSASALANSTNAYGVNAQVLGNAKNNYGLYANVSGATATGAEWLTNNWGIYVNNATKNYITGRVGIGTSTPTKALDVAGDITASVSVSSSMLNASGSLTISGKKVLSMSSNNPERGAWNPFWNTIGSSKSLFQDEEFAQGNNSVTVYNNTAGSTGVTITREVNIPGTPNTSKNRLKITYDGTGIVTPGLGWFILWFTPEYNKTYVQRFRALVPVGYNLVLAENSQGSGSTSYWLTDTQWTGKWEDYIRISHAGNTGSLLWGGHVYLSGPVGVPVTWYIASINVYDVNTSQYMANNTWQWIQTFASGALFAGTGIWNSSGSVGIGTTNPTNKLQVFGDIRVGTSGTNGCIQGFGGSTIAGTCSSDERLKSNIFDIGNVLEKFQDLRIVNYNWNHLAADLYKNDSSQKQTGFLAQNIETLFPELISTNTEGYKQVNYSAMNLYGLEAIKEMNAKMNQSLSGVNLSIADLSTRNTVLETNQSVLFSEIRSLSGKVFSIGNMTGTIVNNYYTTTNQTIVENTGSTDVSGSGIILPENITILDQIEQTIDALFFRIAVIFRESVQFLKEVTFASRVTFEDRDMAGTAIMPVGSNHAHVSFIRPYAGIPKITLSSDSFIAHRVMNKTRYGFDIEMERSSDQEISFDWMALYIPWNNAVTVADPNPSVSSTTTASGESISLIASDSGTLIQSGTSVDVGLSESSGSIIAIESGAIENGSGTVSGEIIIP